MESSPSNQTDPPVAAADPRTGDRWRLTIGQLLLWMATTVLVLAFMQATNRATEHLDLGWRTREPARLARVDWAINRLLAPAYGAVLAGMVIVLKRRAEGKLPQPGHWFFPVLTGWTACLAVFAATAERLLDARDHRPAAVVFVVSMAVVCGLSSLAASRQRGEGTELWYSTFVLLAVIAGGLAASDLLVLLVKNDLLFWLAVGLFAVSGSTVLMAGLTTLLAILADLSEDQPRDGLHWIGVACFVLLGSHPLVLLSARLAAVG